MLLQTETRHVSYNPYIYHSIFFAIQHYNYLVIVILNRLCENNVELEKCIYNRNISKEVVI